MIPLRKTPGSKTPNRKPLGPVAQRLVSARHASSNPGLTVRPPDVRLLNVGPFYVRPLNVRHVDIRSLDVRTL